MVALDGDVTASDYDGRRAEAGQLWSTWRLVVLAASAVVGVRCAAVGVAAGGAGLVFGAVAGLGLRLSGRVGLLGLCIALAMTGSWRGDRAWAALTPERLGAHVGVVVVVDDPQPTSAAVRVIVEVDGDRFEVWARRTGQQERVRQWRAGERVVLAGERVALDPSRALRVAWQHVVGEYRIDWVGDRDAGNGVARASNRVRSAIERAGSTLPGSDGTLFRGLVVGDDRDQPRAMIERFRRSGLSHLTAVSGQNVSFLLAASGPLLRRLRVGPRWALSIALIAWFAALTRFEPSIVRAGVMAGLSATAFALGRERAPVRILAVAVGLLVFVDPLLVWSVGFWLSVGATLGVSAVGPWLASRLGRTAATSRVALPLGVTLGAQLGVAVPSIAVFGRLPLVSVPANLLAVPVAGAVMLYGLPAGLLAGWVPATAPIVMFPMRLGVRWVDSIASIGAAVEPEPPAQFVGWVLVAALCAVLVVRGRPDSAPDPPE